MLCCVYAILYTLNILRDITRWTPLSGGDKDWQLRLYTSNSFDLKVFNRRLLDEAHVDTLVIFPSMVPRFAAPVIMVCYPHTFPLNPQDWLGEGQRLE